MNYKPHLSGIMPTEEEHKEMMDQYIRESKERAATLLMCVEINGLRIYVPHNLGFSINVR